MDDKTGHSWLNGKNSGTKVTLVGPIVTKVGTVMLNLSVQKKDDKNYSPETNESRSCRHGRHRKSPTVQKSYLSIFRNKNNNSTNLTTL